MNANSTAMGKRRFNFGRFYGKYGTILLLVLLFILASMFVPGFFAQKNLTNILRQIAVVTILGFGVEFVIILGHINVALGSEIALLGCISCLTMVGLQERLGAGPALALSLCAAMGMGAVIGGINGYVITKFNIPAFIMTLAVTTVARGSALLITGGKPVSGMDAAYKVIGQGYIGPLPISVLILAVLFAVCWIILNKLRFGRHLFAVGGNINAAEASGIRSKNVVRKAFLIDGLMAAVAGVLFMSRMGTAQPSAGVAYEFDAITACVVGGTSLSGGSGTVTGTLIGAIIVGIINNAQNLLGISAYWQQIVKGLIILVAVIIDVVTKQAATRAK